MVAAADEFPLLAAHGLYAADIRGDGNCLFNALSDQLYGNQDEHHKIRSRVIEYMRDNASYYKQFIDVQSGGGLRRNPKRKNAGAFSSPLNNIPPTEAEIERVFEAHLQQMARGGTYGDNMEISAFSAAFGIDVKIYQRDFAYLVSGGDNRDNRDVVHIGYHIWEHYSSIRNISGPHTGPPKVNPSYLSGEDEKKQKEKLAKTPVVLPWMIETVVSSLPNFPDRKAITKALEECKGNVDKAVSQLLDVEEQASMSSQAGSSSAERDPDSEDESQIHGPNKKQDRRLSRASRNMLKSNEDHRERKIAIRRSRLLESTHPPMDLVKEEEDITALATKEPLPISDDDYNPNSDHSDDDDDNHSEFSEPLPSLRAAQLAHEPAKTHSAPPSITAKHPNYSNRAIHRKKPTARERKDMKKAAQKAAAKERKQASNRSATGGITNGVAMRVGSHGNTPVINIKTLYI